LSCLASGISVPSCCVFREDFQVQVVMDTDVNVMESIGLMCYYERCVLLFSSLLFTLPWVSFSFFLYAYARKYIGRYRTGLGDFEFELLFMVIYWLWLECASLNLNVDFKLDGLSMI
jgi:hypothetical protein